MIALLPDVVAKVGLTFGDAAEDREHYKYLARHAAAEANSDFPSTNAYSTIALWAAVEVMVHDVARAAVLNDPTARSQDALRRITVSLLEFEEMDELDRADYLLRRLEEARGGPLKRGIGRFDTLLGAVGLGGVVDVEVRKTLAEMSAVRNVLVHRGAVADRRFVNDCPWYGANVGDAVDVSTADLHRYHGACSTYLTDVAAWVAAKFSAQL